MDFEEYSEEAKRIEKKAAGHKPYSNEISVMNLVDLSPDEYVELDYNSLMNLYERMQKIVKASQMLAKAAALPELEKKKAAVQPPRAVSKEKEAAAKEVEEKIKQMTIETIETAEKMKTVQLAEEKEEKPPVPEYGEIEFEREMEKERVELEKEAPKPRPPPQEMPEIEIPEIEIGREAEAEKKEEREEARKKEEAREVEVGAAAPEKEPEIREEKRPVAVEVQVVFPAVLESPDKAAESKYREIEKGVLAAVGEEADEAAIKKKMLELTKELFKEKSTSRREQIKLEITVLKNLLAQRREAPAEPKKAKRGKAKPKPAGDMAHTQLFETIVSTQRVETAQIKDSITTNYKNQIIPMMTKFERAVAEAKTSKEKKDAYDAFVFQLTSILEHTPAIITKYAEYLKKKHMVELANLEKSLEAGEAALMKKIDERKDEVKNYDEEFKVIHDIIKKEIEALIRRGGHEVFKKAEEEKTSEDIEEEKIDEILGEIQAMDEGSLLFYLHSKDPAYYKKYERNQLSKAEALSHAKTLLAREKGLNDAVIKKYFGNSGG